MTNKAYTFRLNPSTEQIILLAQHGGAVRWLWNKMLDANIKRYNQEKKFNFQFDMNRLTTELRKEHNWLKEINSQVLQQKNRDLDSALKRSFNKHGFPKFKKKSHQSDSFRVPQFFKLSNKGIYLPKIGWIKWKNNRRLTGKAKSVTIKQDLDNWVAVVLCELPDVPVRNIFNESEIVGIDVGIKDFAVLSDGRKINNPKHFEKSSKLVKRKQRELSKKIKGSNNRNKARKDVTKLHRRIANQRKDFQWKQVSSITKNYSVICMEDLNIKGMKRNHKLSKSISSVGWLSFKNKLTHKIAEQGGLLVNIDRFAPSTKMCGSCGALNSNLTLADRAWDCDCGTHHDRDINAANNIRLFGLREINRLGTSRIHGCGDVTDGNRAYDLFSHISMKHQNPVIGSEAAEFLFRQ